jgi:CHAD domain-containing protein
MRRTLEREVRLEPGDAFALPELPGTPLASRIFTSTYHDTAPRSLARAGITLRRRLENGVSLWQLKLPVAGPRSRTELEVHGGPIGPPAEIADLLVAHLRHGPLEPVATLRTRRKGVRVADGSVAVADVVYDAVDVLADGHAAGGFGEIEVELIDGHDDDLERLSQTLQRAGARASAGTPKLMRVLALDAAEPPARKAAPVEHLRWLLMRQLREIEAHDPGVRLGVEAEEVHKFRVATRRSRALIRAARPLIDDRLKPLAGELKWLGGALGPVRDLDVLLDHLREQVAGLDGDRAAGDKIVASFEKQRDAARAAMLDALSSERYLTLLDRFAADVGPLGDVEADVTLEHIAGRELRRLQKAYGALGPDPSDDTLHELRIHAKRARYASELAASGGRKRYERAVDALKEVQDVVGAHQDAVVAEQKIRKVSRSLAAGRLIEAERARRVQARAELPQAWRGVESAAAKL